MTEGADAAAGLSITRVFDAPRETVFKAWTDPASFAYWFGGRQAEVPVESVEMDVRPGGEWRATMLAGGREIPWKGVYKEVVEPERLVFSLSDDPSIPVDSGEYVTVQLTDLGDGRTEMRVEQSGGHLPPEGYEQAKQGYQGFFDAMQEHLAGGGR